MNFNNVEPLRIADAFRDVYHVFVRDYVTDARIGVYDEERDRMQPVRINVDLAVDGRAEPVSDSFAEVVCYHGVVRRIEAILAAGHIQLAETLAGRIADMALEDGRVITARVRVEKLAAIGRAASVGVEIERSRNLPRR